MRNKLLFAIFFVMVALLVDAQPVTITPPSANIEPGESVTLTASGAMYYTWSPATGLSTTEGPVTVASPMVTTTYTCSGYGPGAESVVNGDFTQGNVGFTSAYEYNTNLWMEGTYYVDHDASLHHENFFGTGHGDGGNFMIVNGSTTPQTNVWTEQIAVQPNTYYAFSTWVCTLAGQAHEVALLQFSINGNQIGEVFSAPPERYIWEQFYELWYSGTATSATITILNQNTGGSGNDFGLDDISFCELVLLGAPECTVYVGTVAAGNDHQEGCYGEAMDIPYLDNDQLLNNCEEFSCQIVEQATHGTATCAGEDMTYVPNPGFSGNDAFRYRVSCGTQWAEASVSVTVYPANDTTIVDPSICIGDYYDFHGTHYDQDGQVAYFDTIDGYGCLKVEKLMLSVSEYQMPPVLYQYECYESGSTPSWTWDKTGVTYHADIYDEIILDDPESGCPIRHRLDLKFHESYYREEQVEACDHYTWPVNGITYTESMETEVRVPLTPFPCDSVIRLQLTINNSTVTAHHEIDQGCDSVPFDWFGTTHYLKNDGVFEFHGETVHGCDSAMLLTVSNLEYTPHPVIECNNPDINQPHYPITATEFNVNRYTYSVSDSVTEQTWDDSQCEWSISKESWRIIVSDDNRSCMLYIMDWVEDTVWLTYRAVNPCSGDGVIARYWLKPSFYGVGEQQGSLADFSVSPNPSNGQMTLRFENLTGRVDVKVYDMRGALIDNIFITNDLYTNSIDYDMSGCANGVYCFVVSSKEGVVSRKVVISK